MTESFKVDKTNIDKVNELLNTFQKKVIIKKKSILKEENLNFIEVCWNGRYFVSLGLFGDEVCLTYSVEDTKIIHREGTLKSMEKQMKIFKNQFEVLKIYKKIIIPSAINSKYTSAEANAFG